MNIKIPKYHKNLITINSSNIDFHNKNYKGKLSKKLKILSRYSVITGDIIDRRKVRNLVTDFIKEIKDIAPIYYVSGNLNFYQDYNRVKEF